MNPGSTTRKQEEVEVRRRISIDFSPFEEWCPTRSRKSLLVDLIRTSTSSTPSCPAGVSWLNRIIFLGGWLLALSSTGIIAAEPGVTFSDGSTISGEVRLVPGGELRFHDGTNFRTLTPQQVGEIRLHPTSERLVRAFAMPEPGKAIRVETGDPYPLRELSVIIGLTSGESLRGHLYATAVLVALEEEDRKVFIPAKQQGAAGTSLAALVYPQRIVFAPGAESPRDPTRLKIETSQPIDALGLVTRDTLAALDAVREDGFWRSDALLGSAPYVAVQSGMHITVGWDGDDADLHRRLAKGIEDIRDYYEDKQLIAVRAIPGTSQVDSVMRLVRRGPSTDGSSAEGQRKPWHVEIWRWVVDDMDPTHLLLSARGTLFRGLYASEGELPQVQAVGHLWPQHREGTTLRIGSTP